MTKDWACYTTARKGMGEAQLKFEITKSDDPTLLPGLAIFKEGGIPQMQPDSSYPHWLWGLTTPGPLYSELLYKATSQGLESLTKPELKQLILRYKKRMQRRAEVLRKKKIIDQTIPEDEMPDWWPRSITRSNEHMDRTMSHKMHDIRGKKWGGEV